MSPHRVQLSRAKGWRMPPNTVKVDRSTKWGNPWSVHGARQAGYSGPDSAVAAWCVSLFREWIEGRPGSITAMLDDGERLRQRALGGLPALRGKNLACWCKPGEPCHADTLLEIANAVDRS